MIYLDFDRRVPHLNAKVSRTYSTTNMWNEAWARVGLHNRILQVRVDPDGGGKSPSQHTAYYNVLKPHIPHVQ